MTTNVNPGETQSPVADWREVYEKEKEIERQAILFRIHHTRQDGIPHHDPRQTNQLAVQIMTNPDFLEEVVQEYLEYQQQQVAND